MFMRCRQASQDPSGDKNATHRDRCARPKSLQTFADFYPFYLTEHSNVTCRRLHYVGLSLTLVCLAMLIVTGKPQYLLCGLLCGYGFAWVGHFDFEKNKLASFNRPAYSFMGDWVMYRDIWLGKVKVW
jgi:hypothetical protein